MCCHNGCDAMWHVCHRRVYSVAATTAVPRQAASDYGIYPPGGLKSNILASYVACCSVPAAFTICYQLLPGDWVGLMVTAIIFVAATLALFFTFGRGRPPASYRVSAAVC